MSNKHICGVCSGKFESEAEYLAHKCEDGFTPEQPEHLGEAFVEVSRKAVERGKERSKLEKQGMDPEKAKKEAEKIVREKHTKIA